MLNLQYDRAAHKKATNLSINSELLTLSKQYRINLSKTLEEALITILKNKIQQDWLAHNQEALAEYNQRVAKDGSFGDHVRKF